MWVADAGDFDSAVGNIFAYDMATKQRDSAKDFNTLTGGRESQPRRNLVGRDHHVGGGCSG